MITFVLLKETYEVKGLPQDRWAEIVGLVKESSGTVDDMESENDNSFNCKITLPPNSLAAVQANVIEMFGGTK